MDTEIWKDIIWYEWLYQVSSFSRIKSFKFWLETILKFSTSRWYFHVWLCKKWIKKTVSVHRLVAKAFIQNPENKRTVNHINWIKTDNSIKNLEWATDSENLQHAYNTWLKKVTENYFFYKDHINPSKWLLWKEHFNSKNVYQYTLEWEFIREWGSQADVYRELWISQWNISSCCIWRYKKAGGFIWKYS